MNIIEKPWCTFGDSYAWGFGKIIKEHMGESLEIVYSERQLFSNELWLNDPHYVQRFDTLEEAAKKYQEDQNNHTTGIITDEQLVEDMHYKFPTYFKKERYSNDLCRDPRFK